MSIFGGRLSVLEFAMRNLARLWLVAAAILLLHWAGDLSPKLAGGPEVGALGIEFEEPSLGPTTSGGLSRSVAQGSDPGEGTDHFGVNADDDDNHSKSFASGLAWRFEPPTNPAVPVARLADPVRQSASGRAFNPRAPPSPVS
jgi:hypothetical protein